MKYLVAFFTRTGTSRRVAEKIAENLSCDIVEIKDNINWSGIFGYIKAGYYSSTNKNVEIDVPGNLGSYDGFFVVTPLWAGGIAPAMRALLKRIPHEKVHLVVTSDGSRVNNRNGYKSVVDIVKNNNDEQIVVNEFLKIIK